MAGGAPVGGWRLLAAPLEPATVEEVAAPPPAAWIEAIARAAGVDLADPAALLALAAVLDARRAAEEAPAAAPASDGSPPREARDEAPYVRGESSAFSSAFTRAPQTTHSPASPGVLLPSARALFAITSVVAAAEGIVLTPPTADRARGLHPIVAIGRASRVRVRQVELLGAWWEDGGPALVAFRDGRPVALLADRHARYTLMDAPGGRAIPVRAAIARTIAPQAFQLVRPFPEGSLGLGALAAFAARAARGELGRVVGWGLAITAVQTTLPVATGLVIDQAVPDADLTKLGVAGVGLLAATLGGAVFTHAQSVGFLRLEGAVTGAAQAALWDRLLRLPLAALRPFPVGELVSRVSAVSAVGRHLTGAALGGALGGVLGLPHVLVLLAYSQPLATIAVLLALGTVALSVGPALVLRAASRGVVAARSRVFSATVQLCGGVAKVQAAGVQDAALAWWWRRYAEQLDQQARFNLAEGRLQLLRVVLPLATSAVLFAFAARLHAAGALSVGAFVAFNATFALLLGSLGKLTTAVLDITAARAEAERAAPLLSARPEVHAGAADPGELTGGIEIEKLRFRYRPDGPWVVDGLSLSIRPGQFVALVGGSGCGKSTLLRLLLGFESAESGRVLFDGKDLAGLDGEQVRRQLGVVLQSGRLGGGSILDTVAGANLVGVDAAWRALDAASMRAEVEAMPMGIHTLVGEGGGNLSGGQRQRLLIARALVSKPKILIFDEATSALDNRSQAAVSENLGRLDVTRIVVAHRLSTVRNADRIYVLDGGRVVESGTFAELEGAGGAFARLVARQRAG